MSTVIFLLLPPRGLVLEGPPNADHLEMYLIIVAGLNLGSDSVALAALVSAQCRAKSLNVPSWVSK